MYLAATLANLFIPKTPVEHPPAWRVGALFRDFHEALRTLWRNRDARLSLLGTGLFWGTGSTLRLALFAWVPVALGLADNGTPAKLMGLVSIGIVAGALLAGWLVRLEQANRALIGGLLLGPLVLLLSGTGQLVPAIILLVAVGLCGGFFVVPLNALLQERGHESVGAGRALAVQNLFENLAMLVFVAGYTLTVRADVPVTQAVMAFGLLVTLGVASLSLWRLKGKQS
jgi:LPLT family lysophospholipid transporter-like MFS transporter